MILNPGLRDVQISDRQSRPYSHGVAYDVFVERLPNIPWPKVSKTNQPIEIRSIVVTSWYHSFEPRE